MSADKKIDFSEEQGMLLDVAREFVRDKSPGGEVKALLETADGFRNSGPSWLSSVGPESTSLNRLAVPGWVLAPWCRWSRPWAKDLGTPLPVLASELIRRAGGIAEEDILETIASGAAATLAYLDGSDWGADNCGVTVDEAGVLSGSKFMVPMRLTLSVASTHPMPPSVIAIVAGDAVTTDAKASHPD